MKKIVLAFLWGIATFEAISQNTQPLATDTLKMSLQECIDYALKNNVNVKNSTLDEAIAKSKIAETRSIGLPQINGSVGLQHYFKLRNTYIPGNSTLIPSDLGLNANDIVVLPAIFQLPSTLDASVTASQILFNASYLVGLKAARTYKELSEKNTSQTKQTTANSVKKAYYAQLIALERIKLFDANIVRLDTTLRQTKALQKNGFAESIDVDRIEVSYNNLLTEFEKTLNLLALASLQLKYQMGMPLEQNLYLVDKIEQYMVDTTLTTIKDFDYNNRIEYQLLQTQKKLNKLDVSNNRAANLPSLVLQGTLGIFSSVKNADFFSTKNIILYPDFANIKRTSSYWSNYSYIQVGLNVPIFAGFQRNSRTQQAKLSLQKTENNIKNFEQTIDLQVELSKVNLKNAYKSLSIQNRNMSLAKNVSNVTYKKYRAGTGSNSDVTNAEYALKEAQVNYFNSLYDYLVYKTDYEQALGQNKY